MVLPYVFKTKYFFITNVFIDSSPGRIQHVAYHVKGVEIASHTVYPAGLYGFLSGLSSLSKEKVDKKIVPELGAGQIKAA